MKSHKDDVVHCFRVISSDGRQSSLWRVWSGGNDVYLCPYAKRGDFKISLHGERWRIAWDRDYARMLQKLGTWHDDRCFLKLKRPTCGHAIGFTRGVRIYFPDSELRHLTERCQATSDEQLHEIPIETRGEVRVVDLLFTDAISRFNRLDWPLRGSLNAKLVCNWALPKPETVWLVHFAWTGIADALDAEADWFRSHMACARKLDERSDRTLMDPNARIFIPGRNQDSWIAVIDAAANHEP